MVNRLDKLDELNKLNQPVAKQLQQMLMDDCLDAVEVQRMCKRCPDSSNFSLAYIVAVMNGEYEPPYSSVSKIANACGYGIDIQLVPWKISY